MRVTTLTLACLAALLTGKTVSAQDWARKMFSETSHEFGTVARGAKVEHRFVLKNKYKETIHISGIRSSCGCTVAILTKATLKSLETAEVIAKYNTTSFLGHRDAVLTVTIDEPYFAQVQLRVSGFIRSDVVLNPGSVNFGRVRQGTKAQKWINVSYAGRNDWAIVDVRTANPFLEAELYEKKRGDGQVEYQMLVRLSDKAPLGFLRDQLTIVTNDGKLTRIPVDVEGKVESEVTVSPEALVFGVLKPGEKVTKRIIVRAAQPFRITRVGCGDNCFEFKTTGAKKTYHLIPVTFVANQAGKVTETIHIETDLGEGAVPDITAYVQVVDQP